MTTAALLDHARRLRRATTSLHSRSFLRKETAEPRSIKGELKVVTSGHGNDRLPARSGNDMHTTRQQKVMSAFRTQLFQHRECDLG